MISTVAIVALGLAVTAFAIYVLEWVKDFYDRLCPPTPKVLPGVVGGQGKVGETVAQTATAAKTLKEAGPMYASLAASFLFLLVAAIGSGISGIAG
jgi:hypothetical protein